MYAYSFSAQNLNTEPQPEDQEDVWAWSKYLDFVTITVVSSNEAEALDRASGLVKRDNYVLERVTELTNLTPVDANF